MAVGKMSKALLKWRKRQKPGGIMRRTTFKKIERSAAKHGYGDPTAVAGAAYWRTAKAKYRGKKRSRH